MHALHEQYRPTSFEDVVGQDRAVRSIKQVIARGWGGRAWWFTGFSGTGKSTLARIIAQHGADEFGIEEIDAGLLTPAALREIEDGLRFRGLGNNPGRVVIVNEAHGLRRDTIRLLLVTLERLPSHAVFIFTTTAQGQQSLFEHDVSGDASPLLSRCTEIVLANDDEAKRAFAVRARQIAVAEGIDGVPEQCYAAAAVSCKGNMRALLQRIESGAFRQDAAAVLQREFDMLRTTKGTVAAARRETLEQLLKTLQ